MFGSVLERPLTREEMINPEEFNKVALPIAQLFNYLKTEVEMPCGCNEVQDGPFDRTTWRFDERRNLYNIAVHLNNHHKWTREQIADWLECEEEKLGFVTLVEELEADQAQTLHS